MLVLSGTSFVHWMLGNFCNEFLNIIVAKTTVLASFSSLTAIRHKKLSVIVIAAGIASI